jgi:hypothetical protein
VADWHLFFKAGLHAQLHGKHGHDGSEKANRGQHDRAMPEKPFLQADDKAIQHGAIPQVSLRCAWLRTGSPRLPN